MKHMMKAENSYFGSQIRMIRNDKQNSGVETAKYYLKVNHKTIVEKSCNG